jgi:HlyD family secretion protein
MKKWIVIILLVAGAGGGTWWWKHRSNDAPQYQTTAVTRGDLTQVVTATGPLNPVANVQVGCQISGTLAKLFVDYNSAVTQGQVIAQLDAATYRATLHQAEGELANAKAVLELAQVNARRSQELLDGKLIPRSDFDQATATLHQAEASVKIKSAALERAQVDLDRCTIFSPVAGLVISRNVEVGQTVAASLSAPTLFVIANDLTKMQIDANVAEADIGGVEVGQSVDFTVDAFPTRTFQGQVVQVRNAPLTVQNVVTYDTVIAVNNRDLKLKPGMTANVSIVITQRPDVLKIPNAALRFRLPEATPAGSNPGKKREARPTRTVYILGPGDKPQPVQIKTGITDGIATEILDGLNEGDKVVTSSTVRPNSPAAQNPFSPGGMPRRF